jgi:ankyrin repeat protein
VRQCGRTPLQFATLKNKSNVVRRLIQMGADPHLRDHLGIKALDVCPKGDTLILLYEFEEGGPPEGLKASAGSSASLQEAAAVPPPEAV